MHEFSIAQNIIEIVKDAVTKHQAGKVKEVVLGIGTLSGIEITALDTALESLVPGTILEGSEIKKNIIRAMAKCRQCNTQFEPEAYYSCCTHCGAFGPEILSGTELKVLSVTTD